MQAVPPEVMQCSDTDHKEAASSSSSSLRASGLGVATKQPKK